MQLEDTLGVKRFHFSGQKPVAIAMFLISATFNLSSTLTMAVVGKGTPLPMDCASKLVVKGLYRYVRNPMAIGGLGMGFAIAVGLGSISVLIYVVAGMVFWNYFVRPIEERDLGARFGESYERYCDQVKCWFPTFSFEEFSMEEGDAQLGK